MDRKLKQGEDVIRQLEFKLNEICKAIYELKKYNDMHQLSDDKKGQVVCK